MSFYYGGFLKVLWELGQRTAWRSDVYSHIHQSILDYTYTILVQLVHRLPPLQNANTHGNFWRGRVWYPFSHGQDIIGRLQLKACLANTELLFKKKDNYWILLSFGMRTWEWDLIALNAVWYSIEIPPTHSQTICVIVCRQSTYSFDTVYIVTNQIWTIYTFQTFQELHKFQGKWV